MEKHYQVFLSSTYEDLKEERNEAMKVLLEMDCIPTAMELFPAADESSWSYIKGAIDKCDYYILILGGRYGSVDADGISFTEKEYRYAASKDKPRIVFIPENFDNIPAGKTERDPEKRKKLDDFIHSVLPERVHKKWSNPDNLGSAITRGMLHLIKTRPATGWVRADQVGSVEQKDKIIRLHSKIEELESQLKEFENPFGNIEDLAFGSVPYTISYILEITSYSWKDPLPKVRKEREITLTWDAIFEAIAPHMFVPFPANNILGKLRAHCLRVDTDWVEKQIPEGYDRKTLKLSPRCIDEIKVQLMVIGLIKEETDEEKPSCCYWNLTPKGKVYVKERMGLRKPRE